MLVRGEMARSVAIFPGQGSQYPGMGRHLYERCGRVKETFDRASDVLGWELWRLCEQGTEEELNDTSHSQPAIFTLSYAIYQLLREGGWRPDIVAGHSLGEFTAAVAAGALSFEDGGRAVAERGRLMAQAASRRPGAMLAVLGADQRMVEERVAVLRRGGLVQIANYNCPGQLVVSLEKKLLKPAKRELGSIAKKVVELPVSGGFHSPLMAEAQAGFAEFLAQAGLSFKRPRVPILLSATLAPSRDPVEIKDALIMQITSPVRWEQMVARMVHLGIEATIEVGPKDVLTKLVRRIDRGPLALATDGRDPQEVIWALGLGVR